MFRVILLRHVSLHSPLLRRVVVSLPLETTTWNGFSTRYFPPAEENNQAKQTSYYYTPGQSNIASWLGKKYNFCRLNELLYRECFNRGTLFFNQGPPRTRVAW